MRLNRFGLRLIGLWPQSKGDIRDRLTCHLHVFAVFLMGVFGCLLPYTLALIKTRKNVTLMLENLQVLLPAMTCVVRLIFFWWKKEAMTPIIDMIANDWREVRDKHEKEVMIVWARRARAIIMIGYSVMGFSCVLAFLLPAFGISIMYVANTTGKALPLQPYDMYDSSGSPQYELTYVSQVVVTFFYALIYTNVDTFLSLLVFHICGQLNILSARVVCQDKLIDDSLRDCVVNHVRLLRAVNMIENTYNTMLLILFVHFGVLFALYGFQIITLIEGKNGGSMNRVLFFVCDIINIFVHMGLYCTVGEILAEQCNRLHYAIYSQKWYIMDSKMAKRLILLLIRSEEPSYITAGKVFPMTMTTFCHLVKTSAGYMSVLYTMRS